MPGLKIRKGTEADNDWLYRLFRSTSKEIIDNAWGWDELFQREGFTTILPGNGFTILEVNNKPIGGYHLAAKSEYLWLELILIEPAFQRKGYGSFLMNDIQQKSKQADLPVKLSVLRINPAINIYPKHGFVVVGEDEHSLKMQWEVTSTIEGISE